MTSLYEEQYQSASNLFDTDPKACIRLAELNLTDPTLPPYYVIHNCILIACALDDWSDADIWQRRAEQAYWTCAAKAELKQDAEALKELKNVRKELDQLEAFRREDLNDQFEKDFADEMRLGEEIANQDQLDDMENMFEDADAVAENEMEVAADQMDRLAIEEVVTGTDTSTQRPTFTVDSPADPPADSSTTTSEPAQKTLRGKKAKKGKKGGAFHAHTFNKSYGKNVGTSRPSVLGMDWAQQHETEDN